MSVLSATFRPVSGLENATAGQKLDCTKEKMTSGLKFAAAQGVIAGAGTLGIAGALNSDKFSKAGSVIVDKAAKATGLKEVVKEVVEKAKANPAAAKTIALVGGAALALSTIVSIADVRKNAKIEGKHQERVDHTNMNTKA